MSDPMKEVVETLDPVTRSIIPPNIDIGNLVPLRTTLEVRDCLSLGHAYITRGPQRSANEIVALAKRLTGEDASNNMQHLRRCSKPADLPQQLQEIFLTQVTGPSSKLYQSGRQGYLYIMLGLREQIVYEELVEGLHKIDGVNDDMFIGVIPVPLLAPNSQIQANMWSQQFWQTVYRKQNPLGPHPSSVCRSTVSVGRDASIWMTLAQQVARTGAKNGFGEPIGAVIVKRITPGKPDKGQGNPYKDDPDLDSPEAGGVDSARSRPAGAAFDDPAERPSRRPRINSFMDESGDDDAAKTSSHANDDQEMDAEKGDPDKERTQIVAIAADARWYQQDRTGRTGNPAAHAAMRAISMVAQKLVRAENRPPSESQIMEFEAFQDKPLFSDEQVVFDAEHPCPDGYLCHNLELFTTHEPCTMCAMAILHSRVERIVYRHRMPLTGGMSPEARSKELCGTNPECAERPCGGGQGLGLHWRKELNWTMYGWEWEAKDSNLLQVDPHLHA